MTVDSEESSVKVALRIRPQSAAERLEKCQICTYVARGEPQVVLGKDKAFTYDFVYDIPTEQEVIFRETTQPYLDGCFKGFNATVVAYGQTGSGKTYTMGTGFGSAVPAHDLGIIPRAIYYLFDSISRHIKEAAARGEPVPDFQVTASFIELYNEEIIDLLDAEGRGRKQIKISEDMSGNIVTAGITMQPVMSVDETFRILENGALSRTTASTNMNVVSSRSHAIFTLYIQHHRFIKTSPETSSELGVLTDSETFTAKFNFVDLAGSERLKRTGAVGDRAREGISINQGLLCLGNVISALGDQSKKGCHVPYRDSKLTRLLQDSLGGNSQTIMIACISPSDRDFVETLNTLRYANRARNIKNKVIANQDMVSKQISEIRAENQRLQLELLEYKSGKLKTDGNGQQFSDLLLECSMLREENKDLRVKLKCSEQALELKTGEIADLKFSGITSSGASGSEDTLMKNYIKETEELRTRLVQAESMYTSVKRRCAALEKQRSATNTSSSISEVVKQARLDHSLQKSQLQKTTHSASDHAVAPSPEEAMSDSDSEDEDDDVEVAEDLGDDDDQELSVPGDSTVQNGLIDVESGIALRERLIEELENSERRMHVMRQTYEDKLNILSNKVREIEMERDRAIKSVPEFDQRGMDKVNRIKKDYDKKLSELQKEIVHLQEDRKRLAKLSANANEKSALVNKYRAEIDDMKKAKVKLMKQLHSEVSKTRVTQEAMARQLETLKKQSRQKDIKIKELEIHGKQKDAVMRRKLEELEAQRKLARPVSGRLGHAAEKHPANELSVGPPPSRLPLPTFPNSTPTCVEIDGTPTPSRNQNPTELADLNSTFVHPANLSQNQGLVRSPAVSLKAKKKWELLENKINTYCLWKQALVQMEGEMEHLLQERDRITKKLESARRKLHDASVIGRDEIHLKELQENVDGCQANLDFIQEKISESQKSITDMEEEDMVIKARDVMKDCNLSESKYIMQHLYSMALQMSQDIATHVGARKEMEIKLAALELHFSLQSQLVENAFYNQNPGSVATSEQFQAPDSLASSESSSALGDSTAGGGRIVQKSRRKTAVPDDLVKPLVTLGFRSTLSPLSSSDPSPRVPSQALSESMIQCFKDMGRGQIRSDEAPPALQVDTPLCLEPEPGVLHSPNAHHREVMFPDQISSGSSGLSQYQTLSETSGPATASTWHSKTRSGSEQGSLTAMSSVHHSTDSDGRLPCVSPETKKVQGKVSGSFIEVPMTAVGSSGCSSGPETIIDVSSTSQESSSRLNADQWDITGGDTQTRASIARFSQQASQDGLYDPPPLPVFRAEELNVLSEVGTFSLEQDRSRCLSASEDMLFIGTADRCVKAWDIHLSKEALSLPVHNADVSVVKYNRHSHTVVAVCDHDTKVWDVRSGALVKNIRLNVMSRAQGETVPFNSVALNYPGNKLLLGAGSKVVMVDVRTYLIVGGLVGHSGEITSIAAPTEDLHCDVVATGSADRSVKIYDLSNSSLIDKEPTSTLSPVHCEPVQLLGIKDEAVFSCTRSILLRKWDFWRTTLQKKLRMNVMISTMDFLPSMPVMVAGCRNGSIRLYDTASISLLGRTSTDGDELKSLTVNSSLIFSSSGDCRTVQLWKPSSKLGENLRRI